MNTNQNTNGNGGLAFVRVVFFMAQNPDDPKRYEPLAYFPDLPWDSDGRNKTSYMHNGQHGPCCDAFLFEDCIPPRPRDKKAVDALKKELRGIGYVLTELDTREWLASQKERAAEVKDAIYQLCYKKDSELMYAANAATAEKRRRTA